VEQQLRPMGKKLEVRALIDSVDSIREMVIRGKWATIMPVSVFKAHPLPPELALSEISGVQLNRLLVLATRADPRPPPALALVQEMLDAEFSRLVRQGTFSFGPGQAESPARPG
jgi:LysR family nitrogen assimilation transcriptional regulator